MLRAACGKHIWYVYLQQGSSTGHLRFTFLLSLNLGLHRFPVDLDLLAELDETLVGLLLAVLLEEALAISNDRVDVGLLANSDVQGAIPAVELDVHLDGTVVEASAHEDLLSFVALLAI